MPVVFLRNIRLWQAGVFCVVLCFPLSGCDSSGIAIDTTGTSAVRTLYSTRQGEAGSSVVEDAAGDLLVAGYGGGVMGPTDGVDTKPLILKIGSDGSIIDTTLYSNHELGHIRSISAVGTDLFGLISRYEKGENWLGQNYRDLFGRLTVSGRLESVLFEIPGGRVRNFIATSSTSRLICRK